MRRPLHALPAAALGLFLFAPPSVRAEDRVFDHAESVAALTAYHSDMEGIYALDDGDDGDGSTATWHFTQAYTIADLLYVGYWTASNRLVIANGAVITGAGSVIGEWTDANSVSLRGSTTRWNNGTGTLTLGNEGSSNRLEIAEGARVTGGDVLLGADRYSTQNALAISGDDSRLTYSGALHVGSYGSGNSVTISGGAFLYAAITPKDTTADTSSYIGYGANSTGNTVTVTGTGTRWRVNAYTSTTGLFVGYGGSSNTLDVSAGAEVDSSAVVSAIGYRANANHNAVTVSGAGSLWKAGTLYVGYSGSYNTLDVFDGGAITAGNFYIGGTESATGNVVTVSDGGSLAVSTQILIGFGDGISDSHLVIGSGGSVSSKNLRMGVGPLARDNSLTVDGGSLTLTEMLIVGSGHGEKSSVVIRNGGAVSNGNGHIGDGSDFISGGRYYATTSSKNSVLVTGAGSSWTNTGTLYVGYGGSDNTLTVSDGGLVTSATGTLGGQQYQYGSNVLYRGADNNVATITGANSSWRVTGQLRIGEGGRDNLLAVSDGGTVNSGSATLGYASAKTTVSTNETFNYFGADGNAATVSGRDSASGAASSWTVDGTLTVGYGGQGNTLTVSDGGRVTSTGGLIGYKGAASWSNSSSSPVTSLTQQAANDNAVTVTGAGSRWEIAGDLSIGFDHAATADAFASAYNGYSGIAGSSDSAPGASVTDRQFLDNATGNTLTIGEGGLVTVTGGFSIAEGNFLQMAGGYFAWAGDNVAALEGMIAAGSILFGDYSEGAFTANSSLVGSALYYDSQESITAAFGSALSSINLAGYTILSLATSAVPEPATCAALAGLALLAYALMRRSRH